MKRSLIVVAAVVVFVVAARLLSQGGEPAHRVVTLDQGWTAPQAQAFHYMTQGTRTMPAAWLRALRLPNGTPIMSPSNLQRLGFQDVHARPASNNPYGWPIGIAVDTVGGVQVAGFTCAACHTGQFTYKGTTMRIEGGSTNADINAFTTQLRDAIVAIKNNGKVRGRFDKDAIAYGYPKARLQHDFDREAANPDLWLMYTAGIGGTSVIGGPGRVDALTGIANRLFAYDLHDPNNAIRGTAPTSFPPLWDIWHFDWVQYNGAVRVPMARNVGESLGVGVVTHVVDDSGQLNREPLRWQSSLRVHSLYWMEEQLSHLKPPVWPAIVMGRVDPAQAARGRVLFTQYCMKCHGIAKIAGTNEWAVHVVRYTKIGTDPEEVLMFAGSRFDASKLGLSKSLPGALGIAKFVGATLAEAYNRAGITTPAKIAQYNGWGRTGVNTAPCGYKARPLIGIWATPPFLHNGSVPSIYDMLSQTRPAHPILGNPEYDPVKLGTVQQSTPETMTLDTTTLGNSNAGHWFTSDTSRPGRIGPALTDAQKYDIIAYLKVATYADYPTKTVKEGYPLPCDKNFDWANGKVTDLHINAK